VVGLGGGLAGLFDLWTVPLPRTATATPVATYQTDRRISIGRGLAFGLAFGLVVGLASGLAAGLRVGLVVGLAFGLAVGLAFGSMPQVSLTELVLTTTGAGRVKFMRVLQDAHHRQVLRQAGAVYQFRHAELQDHLAEIHRRNTQPPTST
jgi:predicted lipid-binding transport protein (Tim44 family)